MPGSRRAAGRDQKKLSHDRDPALVGYRFGNQRSATSAGKPSRSGARSLRDVPMWHNVKKIRV